MTLARAGQIVDATLRVLAAVLLASLVVAAWHDASKAWDVWYYHLPFAARIAGIMDAPAYTFSHANQARFDGYPLLGEAIQGALWRITGRPECATFFSLAALPAFAWFLKRAFAVPPHLTLIASLAIPLVQIHATGCYVDLTANTCAAMLALLGYRQVVRREAPSLRVLVASGALAATTANMKFQLVPVVIGAAIVLVATALRADAVCAQRGRATRRTRLVVILALAPFVFATPLKNVVRHGNPVWPVEIHALGRSLPHVEKAYASSPAWLEHAPGPARFAASVLELGLRPIASHERWSIDQWTPPSDPGYRMGGFFGGYVAVNLAALAYAALRRRSREAVVAASFVAGATGLTSVLPQSHELRYYLWWMLLLVALNLVVWSREARLCVAAVTTLAFIVVSWSTGGTYLYASGDSFADLMAAKVDRAALERIAPGERVCVAREPWTFLYAPRFHPGKGYSVQEAESPEECSSFPELSPTSRPF